MERQSDPARLDTELHEYGRGCQYHLSRAYPSDVQADPAGGNRRLEIDTVFLFLVSQNPTVTPILAGYHIFQKTCIRFGNQQCDLDVVLLLMLDIFSFSVVRVEWVQDTIGLLYFSEKSRFQLPKALNFTNFH